MEGRNKDMDMITLGKSESGKLQNGVLLSKSQVKTFKNEKQTIAFVVRS